MIIPAIDLIDGQVVRLNQGDYDRQTTYDLNPVELARKYREAGASLLHVVDLDAAADPSKRQLKAIAKICEQFAGMVQCGGGVRELSDIEQLSAAGVSRFVVGTIAATQPDLLASWVEELGPQRFVVALDVQIIDSQPMVMVEGWQNSSGVLLDVALRKLAGIGINKFLCTDVSRDGMMQGPNVELYQNLVREFDDCAWQASGGVSSLSDIADLANSGARGAIVGKALLTGEFTYEEAMQCWQNA